MTHKSYTEKEIRYNIETLTEKLQGLKMVRTEISQDINRINKQIIAWEELDDSQFKMF